MSEFQVNGRAAALVLAISALLFAPVLAEASPADGAPAQEVKGTDYSAPILRFGAGSKKGGFTRLARVLAGGLEETGDRIRLDIRNTKGSCDNIKRLLRGELDVALVQYDVAAEAFKASVSASSGEHSGHEGDAFGGWMCRISADMARGAHLHLITALTDGAVHMLVRRPVRIDNFSQIGDAPIYLGKDGSGSFETAKVIVGAAGDTVERLNLFSGGSRDAYAALRRQELLVMLRTTERGDDDIADVVASGLASINPLPEDVLNRLIDGYPYYRICQVEPETYEGLEYAVPTICVSTVLLTVTFDRDVGHGALDDRSIGALLDAAEHVAKTSELKIKPRAGGFAEKEPIPLHQVAFERERSRVWWSVGQGGALLLFVLVGGFFLRRYLRRRGYLRDPLSAGFEGHLSNPLVPFAGFALIVMAATLVVWLIEHDSNARLRTLDESFWEMNTFATGNFSTETLKTPSARFVGAMATIMGLGALAWFTAALTNIFARDQTRLFQRRRDHIVILNFREDMLQLIRLLRSPGPARHQSIHVMVPEALPSRVRLQLAKVKALTIHQENPEIPETLIPLRLHRAARVIILESEKVGGDVFHPLRIARAVHQAAQSTGQGGARRTSQTAGRPALAGRHLSGPAERGLPKTLVETSEDDPEALFAPFRGWLHAINARQLTFTWLVHAASEPLFADFFTGIVSFRDDNAEVYSATPPSWLVGRPWIVARRTIYSLEGRAGVLPIGLYRGGGEGIDDSQRVLVNPDFEILIQADDLLLVLAEDAADLLRVLRQSRKIAAEQEERWLQEQTALGKN